MSLHAPWKGLQSYTIKSIIPKTHLLHALTLYWNMRHPSIPLSFVLILLSSEIIWLSPTLNGLVY